MAAIKDVLLRFQIPFMKMRGQCYDGCSTMAGARGGVAAKIQAIEPKAVFTFATSFLTSYMRKISEFKKRVKILSS